MIPRLEIFSWLAPLDNSLAVRLLGWIAGLCALMVILYPAFFFRSTSRAIPFWNTPLMPLLFIGYGVLGGARDRFLLLTPYASAPSQVALLAVALVVIDAAMVAIYLTQMQRSGGAAKDSF